MKTVEINNLNLDLHNGPIGVACSGGADSSILLYTLAKFIDGPITVYTCSNKEKHYVNGKVATDVIEKVKQLTGRSDIKHKVFLAHKQTFQTLFSPLSKFIVSDSLNMMYTAATSFPPDEELQKFNSVTDLYEKRNPNVLRPLYNGKYYVPWFNQDKRFIADVYKELNVLDELFPITRSCEDMNLTEGHCGKCWWCEERMWAFGRLE